MRRFLYPLPCLLLFAGCERSPLEGSSRIAAGIHWKLHTLGEGARAPTDSDSVFLSVRIHVPGAAPGSTFSTERWYAMGTDLDPFVLRMRSGDSATVAMKGGTLPWASFLAPVPEEDGAMDAWYEARLVMRAIRSHALSRELQAALLASRTSSDEDSSLARFLREAPAPWAELKGIHYRLDTTAGNGARTMFKEQVSVHCTTFLLGGRNPVDDTRWGGQPLTWRLGDPGQVVPGMELAVQLLRVGDKGSFIVPSSLAFGPQGARTGMIPPWTPVLFVVERLPSDAPTAAVH